MIIDELFEAPQQCPECGGISFSDLILAEKKDACYYKVKASAKVWPSAYASGRLVQCRKKGAANYGNKSEGVAEGPQEDAKFTPRLQIRSQIETALDQYLDPEKVAGAYTDIQYYKHDGKVYVEVLFNYTDGQKIGPKQRKQFLVNKDFTLTPIKKQGVAEAEPVPGKYSGHFYDAKLLPNGDYEVIKINSKKDDKGNTNPLDLKVGSIVPKGKAHSLQYANDGGMFDEINRAERSAQFTAQQKGVAETRRGQVPMTLKPGETDNLEPEDFEGFRRLPEYLEGRKAQQKAGKDLIQQSPYTYQSDQDWAYRNGAFDQRQEASSADFTKRGPLTTEQGMAEAKRKKKSSRKSGGYFFPGYGYYGGGESGEGGGDGGESVNRGMSESWRDIYNLNKQKIGNNPNLIKTDTVLKMPDGSRYKVKPGDNLSSIAKTSGTKSTPAKSNNLNTKPAVEPKYYSLPPAAAATRSLTPPAKTPAVQNDRPYEFDPRSGKIGVNPSGIADVFRNTERPPSLTRDEIQQQMMQPDLAGPATPGFRHTVQGPEGKEYDFDSEQEARDFVDRIKQLDIKDRESQGLGTAKSESVNDTVKEVSLGDYGPKAQLSQAGAKIKKFFGRDDPATVAAADRIIANRERGMARADARRKPYTLPPVDMEKQRQELTDKYPNIDELVRKAELRRDPDYEMADGQAYYAGQEAEQKYQRLKQIQRIIQGLNEETRQATVNIPAGTFTANITKDKSTNTVSGTMPVGGATLSAKKDLTPGGAQSVTVDTDVAPNLNLSATRKSADYNKGQLAGTKSVTAKYTDTTGTLGKPGQQHTATRTAGVGFGGASGARVGKNYVTQIDKTLSDYMDEAKGINSIRNPNDLQPLEAGGGMGGGGGRSTSGPSPFGPKPGSREASVSITTPNTMTVKQGPNPDYVPPKTLQQKYDELNKKLDQLPPAPPVKVPRPGRAASDQRQKDQAQAPELKDVVPLSPAERNQLRPVDANKMRRSEINKEPPDLSNVRPGRDYKEPSNWDSVRPGLDEQSVAPATDASTLRSAQGQAAGTAPRGLTPQQQTAFAPHLKTDNATGSQYYDTPDTDPKEVGAMMGTKITTPAAQALVKSPQGQAGVIKHLTAVTDPKNAVNPSTTTTTPMSPADAAAAVPDSQPTSEDMHRLRELSGLTNKDIEEQSRKKQPPEEKYGPEYDDMVARVKRLAGIGPMKTVWDPDKRVYKNVPTADQPKR